MARITPRYGRYGPIWVNCRAYPAEYPKRRCRMRLSRPRGRMSLMNLSEWRANPIAALE